MSHHLFSHCGIGDQVYEPEGLEGGSTQSRAKPSFFGQKLNFSGRSQQPKMKKKFFLYLLNEKTEFILASVIKLVAS